MGGPLAVPGASRDLTYRQEEEGMAVRRNNFNGGSRGAVITVANSGGSSGDAFTSIVGSPRYTDTHFTSIGGQLSAVNLTVDADTHLDWSDVAQPGNVFCVRLYMKLVTNVANPQRLFVLLGPTGIVAGVWIFQDGFIAAYSGLADNYLTELTASVPVGTWVRVELRYTIAANGNGTVEMWLYRTADSSSHDSYVISPSTVWPGGKPETAEFHLRRDSGGYWLLDNLAVSDTKLGSAFPRLEGVVGQAVETDAARTVRRPVPASTATETGTGQPVRRTKTRTVGSAAEAGTARSVARALARPVGRAAENDTVSGIRWDLKIWTAAETGSAAPIQPTKTLPVSGAAETSGPQPARRSKARPLALLTEPATARPITAVKIRAARRVVELSAAQPAWQGPALVTPLGPATETASAVAVIYRTRTLRVAALYRTWRITRMRRAWSAGSPTT
ncbi:hypothetical protein [Planomonospora parontospora]|uniref:hypothetical protein n=1 Tax=Planomonospora parontospora TaxID=58119 RepID=UPI0017861A3B|nr:hypothetical protein [Planomonospora parontospora]